MTTEPAAGDPIESGAGTVELRVAELKQLFNSMDPRRSEAVIWIRAPKNSS